jgi:hypothetical protein
VLDLRREKGHKARNCPSKKNWDQTTGKKTIRRKATAAEEAEARKTIQLDISGIPLPTF